MAAHHDEIRGQALGLQQDLLSHRGRFHDLLFDREGGGPIEAEELRELRDHAVAVHDLQAEWTRALGPERNRRHRARHREHVQRRDHGVMAPGHGDRPVERMPGERGEIDRTKNTAYPKHGVLH